MRAIISGGGTGGHIFPALAIADRIKKRNPKAEILFVGAEGRMEMDRVPKAGYKIEGLPIAGLQRKKFWKNVSLPYKLWKSMNRASTILNEFQPDVAIGVGGYASGPLLRAAQRKGIPTILQEQNSYAGLTNKILAKRAKHICVAYDGMDAFFPANKITITGNPVRENLKTISISPQDARTSFGLHPDKKTILIVGGSLGAKCLNEAMEASTQFWIDHPEMQVIWQVGKVHFDRFSKTETAKLETIECLAFVDHMDYAYQAADLLICRAGALTISEISLLGKAALLVPSPYVAEDHQTKNAMALVNKGAAEIIHENDIREKLTTKVTELLENSDRIASMEKEVLQLGKPNALDDIVDIIIKYAKDA